MDLMNKERVQQGRPTNPRFGTCLNRLQKKSYRVPKGRLNSFSAACKDRHAYGFW